jgi:hypothetical protein
MRNSLLFLFIAAGLLLAGCSSDKNRAVCTCQQPKGFSISDGVHRWSSSEKAAPDSIEGKLRSQGKHWTRVPGTVSVGSYVQDILEGRLDQPIGRGAIGKVLALNESSNSVLAAKVDFGRGYSVPLNVSEISLVKVISD